MTWGDEAFARAKAEQKPIFVFVGSFTSELARSMCSQTFANAETSKWLNEHFVCVMVDRQERPDLANLYEAYVVRVKQLSGWPVNVWLTPELLPFEGAAYLGASEDWGRPGFLKEANLAKPRQGGVGNGPRRLPEPGSRGRVASGAGPIPRPGLLGPGKIQSPARGRRGGVDVEL
jgi:hypothetical protein